MTTGPGYDGRSEQDPSPARAGAADWRSAFVEDMAALMSVHGTPRAVLRVLGWMVVCDPPEQSASDIRRHLELSAGTVSNAVRTLSDAGVLRRVTRPGDRTTYYRLGSDAWERAFEQRFGAFTELRGVAERARLAGGGAADSRLCAMRDVAALLESETAAVLRRSRLLRDGAGASPPGALRRDA